MLQQFGLMGQLLRQLKRLTVILPEYHGFIDDAELQEWWTRLIDTVSSSCIQLETFTVQNLLPGANFSWKAPQTPGQQLHALLADLSAISLELESSGGTVVSTRCS
jgi:hypothetical protein